MRAFEVSLNGKRLCLAGVGNDGVLTAMTNWVVRKGMKDSELRVGGLICPKQRHVDWVIKELRVGDSVQIRFLEASKVDRPIQSKKSPFQKESKADQVRSLRAYAKKLGYNIVRTPERS